MQARETLFRNIQNTGNDIILHWVADGVPM